VIQLPVEELELVRSDGQRVSHHKPLDTFRAGGCGERPQVVVEVSEANTLEGFPQIGPHVIFSVVESFIVFMPAAVGLVGRVGVIGAVHHHVCHHIFKGIVIVHHPMVIIHVLNKGIKHILLNMIIHFEQKGKDSVFLVPNGFSIVGTIDSFIAHEIVEVREVVSFIHDHIVKIMTKHHFGEVEMLSILHILHIHFCEVGHEPFVHHLHF
jgi:hypothetical protein